MLTVFKHVMQKKIYYIQIKNWNTEKKSYRFKDFYIYIYFNNISILYKMHVIKGKYF